MKGKAFLTFLIFTTSLCHAQNLVPNPSFEEYLECPYSTAEFHAQVVDWYSFAVTPDYFNTCSNELGGFAGVPSNAWGYQWPITGEAYAGLITYTHSFTDEREYMATELLQSLEIGADYYVMFYASFYDGGVLTSRHCATNRLGVKFFQDPDYTPEIEFNPYLPENNADMEFNQMFIDTANWVLIEGWFTADQTYNWLALGNFYDDENTDTLQFGDPNECYAIYYVENVCVALDPSQCDYLKQEGDISSVNNQNNNSTDIQVYPNPTSDVLKIASSKILSSIQVFNPIGQLILSLRESTNETTIETTHWSKGLYILKVEDENGHQQTFKITKQ